MIVCIGAIFFIMLTILATFILYFILNFFMESLFEVRSRVGKLFSVYLAVLVLSFLLSRLVKPDLYKISTFFVIGEILIICFLILKINWVMAFIFFIFSIILSNAISLVIFAPIVLFSGAAAVKESILLHMVFAFGPLFTAILAIKGKLPWVEVQPE
ncbi:hypothetical protein AMJ44_10490 [candidate division WOR-1 bacterium DG_54_3]|uniref:Uncharacterized protein n=1 Tax=candidate division WOR-1 bacterium DG_54_3 TaxID=1703775 RepID=A0A0S7XS97_UNCSA|nr:MAG: hypothetical protein AMJ44_10490 [candidate division WOR-1 bacterium DG_54_3]